MLTPKIVEKFMSVTMLGANFENSMLYKWWSECFPVQFMPNARLLKQLRYATHNNGHRLSISYLSEVNFSKTYRNKPIDEVVDGLLDVFSSHYNDPGKPRAVQVMELKVQQWTIPYREQCLRAADGQRMQPSTGSASQNDRSELGYAARARRWSLHCRKMRWN